METTIEASTTRVDANIPPSSRNLTDEKQATTQDPTWPCLNYLWTMGEAIVNGPKTKKGQMLFPEQAKP
ncbi:LOW QUALITY PROTEIN: hypothetical protein HID58_005207 [Brassica napus]|uniref:Uncharacterized protein n=1 Tax=Brassica napus TaxID=3708 RepID=A0ABQ8EAT5_BRANA|nr:LOW QUALITY PROTEIN: hypothetical protein HID58_005207 [Brassica napus]